MKYADVKPGETYWYSTRNDWTSSRYSGQPVRIDNTDRYFYAKLEYFSDTRSPDQRARKDPKGEYLRGKSSQGDRVMYVKPRFLRATEAEALALIKASQEARDAAEEARRAGAAEAAQRAEAYNERLAALGVTVLRADYSEGFDYQGRDATPSVYLDARLDERELVRLLETLEDKLTGRSA